MKRCRLKSAKAKDTQRQELPGLQFLKNDTNELTSKTERLTDIENKLMATKGERGRDKLGVSD